MLCGIGGSSIEIAQQTLSYWEVQRWAEYRRKRGSLNVGSRIDRAVAMFTSIYANGKRRQGASPFKMTDFMPYADEPEATIEHAMETWH